MNIFGERFVYGKINLTEYQLRLVRCRAEAALRERELARKFAASKKQLKKRVLEDPLPLDATDAPEDSNVALEDSNIALEDSNVALEDSNVALEDSNVASEDSNTTDRVDGVSVHHDDSPIQDKLPQASRATTRGGWRHYRVPRGFMDWLLGPDRIHLDNLGAWHHVRTTLDPKRRMVHLGGSWDNVLEAYAAVKTLVLAWEATQ